MDIPRPSNVVAKRNKRIVLAAIALVFIVGVTIGVSKLKPAAPSVERSTVWTDAVKRGSILRQVRGLGTLIPEEIRWIPAETESRVERIRVLPGTQVEAEDQRGFRQRGPQPGQRGHARERLGPDHHARRPQGEHPGDRALSGFRRDRSDA